MARKKGTMEIREIVIRLRKRQGIRQIKRETGTHRTIIRQVKTVCQLTGWLNQEQAPTEQEVSEAFSLSAAPGRRHPLDKFKDDFERYVKEGNSFVVMHALINKRYNCSETTIRRYVHSRFPKRSPVVTRRTHIPGEIMEVDFGYLGLVYDPDQKRNRKAWIFSARLRYSRKAYREVVFDQKQQTFFGCHIHAFEYFDGVPRKVVPDNLKAAVIKVCYEDPIINRSYRSLAEYYDFLISPTLPYHPHHKGGVENDIKYVKGNFWPIFKEEQRLRGRTIPYADEIAGELSKWTKEVSEPRIIRGVGRTVNELFIEEKEKLQTRPFFRWDILTWKTCKIGNDCYVSFEKSYYSAPYQYKGSEAVVYGDSKTVHIFLNGRHICSHRRAGYDWEVVRNKNHFPLNSTLYFKTTRRGLEVCAGKIGVQTAIVVQKLLSQKGVDAFRQVKGIVFGFANKYSNIRLENACERALYYKTVSYLSIKKILVQELDKQPLTEPDYASQGQTDFRFARSPEYFKI